MEYPLIELKNKITDRIHENHAREITGEELQEILHDIVDSLGPGAGSGSGFNVKGWHGLSLEASGTFYQYLNEFHMHDNSSITSFKIRAKKQRGVTGNPLLIVRVIDFDNTDRGSDTFTLTDEYQIFDLPVSALTESTQLMIQYKCDQPFNVKEILIV